MGKKYMKEKIVIISIIILLMTLALSGCFGEQEATKTKETNNINFESDILQIYDSSLDLKKENGEIYKVEAALYFKNNLDAIIKINLTVTFCDINDNIIHTQPYEIRRVLPNYKFVTPSIFTYEGNNVKKFDHININVENYEILS
jgi:hypothetical protein